MTEERSDDEPTATPNERQIAPLWGYVANERVRIGEKESVTLGTNEKQTTERGLPAPPTERNRTEKPQNCKAVFFVWAVGVFCFSWAVVCALAVGGCVLAVLPCGFGFVPVAGRFCGRATKKASGKNALAVLFLWVCFSGYSIVLQAGARLLPLPCKQATQALLPLLQALATSLYIRCLSYALLFCLCFYYRGGGAVCKVTFLQCSVAFCATWFCFRRCSVAFCAMVCCVSWRWSFRARGGGFFARFAFFAWAVFAFAKKECGILGGRFCVARVARVFSCGGCRVPSVFRSLARAGGCVCRLCVQKTRTAFQRVRVRVASVGAWQLCPLKRLF